MQFPNEYIQQLQIHSLDMGDIISMHHAEIKAVLFFWDSQLKMSIAFVHVNLVFLTVPWHINVLGYIGYLLIGIHHEITASDNQALSLSTFVFGRGPQRTVMFKEMQYSPCCHNMLPVTWFSLLSDNFSFYRLQSR